VTSAASNLDAFEDDLSLLLEVGVASVAGQFDHLLVMCPWPARYAEASMNEPMPFR
jgi:hypothetical protein